MLPDVQMQAYKDREEDDTQLPILFEEAGKLARQLKRPWWVLIYDHVEPVTGPVFFQRDYRTSSTSPCRMPSKYASRNTITPLKFSTCADLVEA